MPLRYCCRHKGSLFPKGKWWTTLPQSVPVWNGSFVKYACLIYAPTTGRNRYSTPGIWRTWDSPAPQMISGQTYLYYHVFGLHLKNFVDHHPQNLLLTIPEVPSGGVRLRSSFESSIKTENAAPLGITLIRWKNIFRILTWNDCHQRPRVDSLVLWMLLEWSTILFSVGDDVNIIHITLVKRL